MNIIEYLKASRNEYFDEILREARSYNSVYDQAIKRRVTLSTIKLEDNPTFQAYIHEHLLAAGIEQKILYQQGYKDCISLLWQMGILSFEEQHSFFDLDND